MVVVLFLAAGGRWGPRSGMVVGAAFMIMPAVAVVIVQKLVYRRPVRVPLAVFFRPNRWFVVAWILPPVLAVAAFGLSLPLPSITYDPQMGGMLARLRGQLTPDQIAAMEAQVAALPVHAFWLVLAQGLVAGATINAVFAFGEELGWRGLLHLELADLGFWRSSLLIGMVWGLWHAPIIVQGHNYPQHPVAGVFLMVLWCVLLAPLAGYIRLRSGSVIAAAVFHGSLNGTAGLSMMMARGGTDLTTGLLGLPGFVTLAAANAALWWYDRRFEAAPVVRRGIRSSRAISTPRPSDQQTPGNTAGK